MVLGFKDAWMQGLRGLGRFGSGLWTSGFGFWGCGVVGLWGCGFGRGGGGLYILESLALVVEGLGV